MTKLQLIIAASARDQLRWARQHVYAWLVLGPVVIGLSYFTASRVAQNLEMIVLPPASAIIIAAAFVGSLIGFSLSRASAELYHLRRPEAYFDSLQLKPTVHLNAALAARLTRTAALSVAILAGHALLSRLSPIAVSNLMLLPFATLVAVTETLAALNWIHWGHRRDKLAAAAALLLLTVSVTIGALMLVVVNEPAMFSSRLEFLLSVSSAFVAAGFYVLARRQHASWRASDIEYARRLQSPRVWSVFAAHALARRFTPVVRVQIARDIQLTLRGFSSAVYGVLGVSILLPAALIAVLESGVLPRLPEPERFFDITWLPRVMAIKAACVAGVSALAALLPVLVVYELPLMWLERSVGTIGLDMWQAKLWYTRLITLPAPVLMWVAGIMSGAVPAMYALPLLGECLWLWWLISSLVGALSFEMPARPGLAIIVMTTLGGAVGLMGAILWPFGLLLYPQVMHSLTARGRQRARYYLLTEDD